MQRGFFTTSLCLPITDRKSTRLNSSHGYISYAVFCLKKKKHDTRHYPLSASAAYDLKNYVPASTTILLPTVLRYRPLSSHCSMSRRRVFLLLLRCTLS